MDFPESCPKSRPCSGLREVAPLLCGPPRLQPEHVTALALSHQGRLEEDALGGWLDRDKDLSEWPCLDGQLMLFAPFHHGVKCGWCGGGILATGAFCNLMHFRGRRFNFLL